MPWFYAKGTLQTGPVEDREFERLVAAGQILPTDLVWSPEMAEWQPLSAVRPVAAAPAPSGPPALPTAASAASAPMVAPLPVTAAPAPMAPAGQPAGVGGWLLVFCLILTVGFPLLSLRNWVNFAFAVRGTSFSYSPGLLVSFGSSLLLLVASIVVGAMIWSGRSDGRELARKYLIARASYVALMYLINFVAYGLRPEFLWAIVPGVLLEVGFFVIFWRYFQVSRRVRNTYGPE